MTLPVIEKGQKREAAAPSATSAQLSMSSARILGKEYCNPWVCKKPHLKFNEAKQKYAKNLSKLRRDCQSCVQKKD